MDLESNILGLPVENVRLTANFYREYLGFQLENKIEKTGIVEFASLRFADAKITFCQQENYPKKINEEDNKRINIRLKYHQTVSSLYERCKEQVRIVNQMMNTNGKPIEFAVQDCNGFVLNFSV